MAFVDTLAFEMVTLVLAAVTIAYTALVGFLEYRRSGADGLKSNLRSSAVPVGALGGVVVALGVWGEIAWPLPGSYNILFADVYLLFGLVLVAFALTVFLGARLQHLGVFALVAGAIALDYGYQGYVLGLTKDPLEMFGLYGAFGVAAMLAFPATLVADRLLAGPTWSSVASDAGLATPLFGRLGTRAAQPMAKGVDAEIAPRSFALPRYATFAVVVFVAFLALAAIAAVLFLNTTVPSHLASAP